LPLWVFPGAVSVDSKEFHVFADPQSVTYNAVAKSLARIGTSDNQSEYKLNDSGVVYDLVISHQFKARNRAVVRLRRDAYVADALVPAQNVLASMTATMTIDFPTSGYTAAEAQLLGKALVGFLSDANLLKVVNGET
jgi:hypothetical protein